MPPLPQPPTNDDISNSSVLCTGAPLTATTRHATTQAGEPCANPFQSCFQSVWFRWTAAASGAAAVNVTGNTYISVLTVYRTISDRGTVLDADASGGSSSSTTTASHTADESLNPFQHLDRTPVVVVPLPRHYSGPAPATAMFSTTVNSTYYLQVSLWSPLVVSGVGDGTFAIVVADLTPAANDALATAAAVVVDAPPSRASNANATVEQYEDNGSVFSYSGANPASGASLWWTWDPIATPSQPARHSGTPNSEQPDSDVATDNASAGSRRDVPVESDGGDVFRPIVVLVATDGSDIDTTLAVYVDSGNGGRGMLGLTRLAMTDACAYPRVGRRSASPEASQRTAAGDSYAHADGDGEDDEDDDMGGASSHPRPPVVSCLVLRARYVMAAGWLPS